MTHHQMIQDIISAFEGDEEAKTKSYIKGHIRDVQKRGEAGVSLDEKTGVYKYGKILVGEKVA